MVWRKGKKKKKTDREWHLCKNTKNPRAIASGQIRIEPPGGLLRKPQTRIKKTSFQNSKAVQRDGSSPRKDEKTFISFSAGSSAPTTPTRSSAAPSALGCSGRSWRRPPSARRRRARWGWSGSSTTGPTQPHFPCTT